MLYDTGFGTVLAAGDDTLVFMLFHLISRPIGVIRRREQRTYEEAQSWMLYALSVVFHFNLIYRNTFEQLPD